MKGLPLVLNAAAIGAGIAVGSFLNTSGPGAAAEPVLEAAPAATEAPAEPSPEPAPEASAPAYEFEFRRPFIVPIAEDWRTQALVVVDLSLGLGPEDEEAAGRALEARLRDTIMPVLLTLGQEGVFSLPDADRAERVRVGVLGAVAPLLAEEPKAVSVRSIEKRQV